MFFTKVEARNVELIKQMMVLEKNKMDITDRIPKLEQKHSQDNITNNNSSNFNSGADNHEKSSQEKRWIISWMRCIRKALVIILDDAIRRKKFSMRQVSKM